jgi:hypothetical protein
MDHRPWIVFHRPGPSSIVGNQTMFPEITVTELSEKLKSEEKFILLDVRELSELDHAKIEDSRLEITPVSRLSSEGPECPV